MSIAFRASRWGKSLDGTDDYINCPMNRDQYYAFVDALLAAEHYELTSQRTSARILRLACRLRRSPDVGATLCVSDR